MNLAEHCNGIGKRRFFSDSKIPLEAPNAVGSVA